MSDAFIQASLALTAFVAAAVGLRRYGRKRSSEGFVSPQDRWIALAMPLVIAAVGVVNLWAAARGWGDS